ncbi:YadA family autotransporter adhesin [Variovorax sp. 770b2]|uniref:YadA family autotransporter adhesin n=1 Tax=Variovorax sp. 770b2 TaxID=1566271 RepID=UPI0008DFA224|nr:YadA family autotransporter adhesin [Variovorax sp. 770b2]SFQ36653.1 Head domain of trimeric autotransporter adhesin [Variovorax sp. 770b2]
MTTGLFMAAAWADVTIGGNSYVTGSGAVCSSTGAGPTWSCQVPNGNGGIALVSGVPGDTVNGGPDAAALQTLVSGNLGNSAVLIGDTTTKATGYGSVATGIDAKATETYATALGSTSTAAGVSSTAVGNVAQAFGTNATALGANTTAVATSSLAAGDRATASDINATALGANTQAQKKSSLAAGDRANANGINAAALGANSQALADSALAVGDFATASAVSSVAVGLQSTASGTSAIALGTGTLASGANGVALGTGAVTSSTGGVALGAGATADRAGMGGKAELFSNTAVSSTQGAVSVGSAGGERQIANVAGGTQATDAVNVRQLQAVQSRAVNYGTNVDGSVNYNQVTLGNGQAPGGTTISNVAPGVAGTDAVNVNQLNAQGSQANAQNNQLRNEIRATQRDASAGTAGAMAMSGLPQAYIPGKNMVAGSAAGYEGQSAIAIGYSSITDNGRWVMKLTGSANSRGSVGVTAGAGFQW